jgi:hypothetical protein
MYFIATKTSALFRYNAQRKLEEEKIGGILIGERLKKEKRKTGKRLRINKSGRFQREIYLYPISAAGVLRDSIKFIYYCRPTFLKRFYIYYRTLSLF